MIIPSTVAPVSGLLSGDPSKISQPTQSTQSTPLTPTPAQLAFMRSMSGSPTTVNYTLDFLKQEATTLTSKKVDEKTISAITSVTGQTAPVSYPDARRLLASWFSILGPDGQSAAGKTLSSLAPGIDITKLASTSASPAGGVTGPSAEALTEAEKIPTASVKDALMGLLDKMDPSLYQKAGEVAMKAQLTENIVIEGMPLMSYLIAQAKDALQQGS